MSKENKPELAPCYRTWSHENTTVVDYSIPPQIKIPEQWILEKAIEIMEKRMMNSMLEKKDK